MAETFAPTHVVPAAGLPAWAAPDGAQAPVATLDTGLEVQLLEQRDDGWAHVVCSNGWSAWVDGRRLGARSTPGEPSRADTTPAAPSAPPRPDAPEARPVWAPTHVVPAGGLPAWREPDPAQASAAIVDADLEVQLLEQRDDGWARVACSNGWTAWVDGRRLFARRAPSATPLSAPGPSQVPPQRPPEPDAPLPGPHAGPPVAASGAPPPPTGQAPPAPSRGPWSRIPRAWLVGGVAVVAVAVVAVVVLSGGGGSGGGSNNAKLAVARKACALIDSTDFQAAIGAPRQAPLPVAETKSCFLQGPSQSITVLISKERATPADLQAVRSAYVHEPDARTPTTGVITDVPGLDGAFSSTATRGDRIVVALAPLRGEVFTLVSTDATLEQLIDLARRTVARA